MALTNFIPDLWSARLRARLHTALRYAAPGVINREYEGEIRGAGDSVKINSIGAVTVSTYTKNTDHAAPETLSDATRTLLIDQSKMFNFQVDDIDKAQTRPKVMDEAMREAGYAIAKTADAYVASLYTDAGEVYSSDNTSAGDPIAVDGSPDAYEVLVELGGRLDENDVPEDERTAIVPTWFHSQLLLDDRFVNSSDLSEQVLRNGRVGRAAGFDIVKSNANPLVDDTVDYNVVQASHPMYGTFAEQINEVEAYRPERRFGDAVKGLHLYGAKVVRPEALAVAYVSRP